MSGEKSENKQDGVSHEGNDGENNIISCHVTYESGSSEGLFDAGNISMRNVTAGKGDGSEHIHDTNIGDIEKYLSPDGKEV